MKYFMSKINIPQAYQVVLKEGVDYKKDNIHAMSASTFLMALV